MFIVPLSGDKVETTDGASYTVLSYTNYKDSPAVYVQGPSVETKSVPFEQIAKINKAPVKLAPGKVFLAASKPRNALMLPQKDDKLKLGRYIVKVNSLKLNQRDNLAAGMLVLGNNIDTGERVTARLSDLLSIEHADGSKTANVSAFKKQYRDYLGASA